jgi:cell division protein ZapA
MSTRSIEIAVAETVKVTIFNQTYSLRSAGGDEHIREIASMVDERMKQIASHLSTHDISKIAVLTALNIADEMQNLKAQFAIEIEQLLKRPASDKVAERKDDQQPEDARASWFDEIFEADVPVKDKAQRLSSQVSAKLQSLRRNETPKPSIEETED